MPTRQNSLIASTGQLVSSARMTALALGGELACECMVCDLPEDADHGPVEWKVVLFFPGPYPKPGEAAMLLCEHCKEDWVHGEWDPPYDNFFAIQVVPV